MYFKNRAEAGRKLAEKLQKYRSENVAVVALSEGGVIVGAQIAMRLHGSLSLLLSRGIHLPGEPDPIAAITSAGTFTKNVMFSVGQLEQFMVDYRSYIEEERLHEFHRLNILISDDGEVKKKYLRRHVVILVSDGLQNGFSIDVAYDFLKTIALEKLVIATPTASVKAIDRMHIVGDDLECLDVKANFISVDHYYDENTVPSYDDLLKVMRRISTNWKLVPSS